jgi:hypothetical protein
MFWRLSTAYSINQRSHLIQKKHKPVYDGAITVKIEVTEILVITKMWIVKV